jgi:molybdopterin-guanine dinucleotide biosynthesis protein A
LFAGEDLLSNITAAILAGGKSSRMGSDKSFAVLNNKSIFQYVLNCIQELGLPTILITNSPDKYAAYALRMYEDIVPDQGALGGLYTAIQKSETDFTLCVACDMPFLNVSLLKHLLQLCSPDWDVVVPCIGERPEAMHAVYRKTCTEAIKVQLAAGKLKASGFFDQMRVCYVDEAVIRQFDPDLRSFMNVNTLDDLETALRLTKE